MLKTRGSFEGIPHPKDPTELSIERYLTKRIKGEGGLALKLEVKGQTGLPDRLVILPDGLVAFVEVKQRSGVLSKKQKLTIERLRKLGHVAEIVWSYEDVDMVVGLLKSLRQQSRLAPRIAELYAKKKEPKT